MLKRTIVCRLDVCKEINFLLCQISEKFANGCNRALEIAKKCGTFNKIELQKLCYYDIREQTGLSANLTCCAIRRVASSCKNI